MTPTDPALEASREACRIVQQCKNAIFYGQKHELWQQAEALHERCPTEATALAVEYTCRHTIADFIPRRAS